MLNENQQFLQKIINDTKEDLKNNNSQSGLDFLLDLVKCYVSYSSFVDAIELMNRIATDNEVFKYAISQIPSFDCDCEQIVECVDGICSQMSTIVCDTNEKIINMFENTFNDECQKNFLKKSNI